MKKLVPLLFLGMAMATIFYFLVKEQPAGGRLPMAQHDPSPESQIHREAAIESSRTQQMPSGGSLESDTIGTDDIADSLIDFKKARAKAVADQLTKDLNEILFAKNFSQEEIDLVAKYVGNAFLNAGESVALSSAIDEASAALKLNSERKEALASGIFSAVTGATDKYTYSEYQICQSLRVARASDCVKEIAQDLIQKVTEKSEGEVLNAQAISSLDPEGKAAVKKAIEVCGESAEKAEAYLAVNLAGCL